ncbi:GAF domain-containing protein [Variovorax sp. GT1P44]|uniref:GAF domain-containing protein n=1 Tax=Variovorax sp. GT1P44 TaxID=3443742 RepID=UPI003F44A78F
MVTADADMRGCAHLERSIGTLLRVVREQLNLEVVFVGEFVGGARVFRHVSAKSKDPVVKAGQSHPLDMTICKRIVDGRMPRLMKSVAQERARYQLPEYYEVLGGHIGVPVQFADGNLYGVLCGFSFTECTHLDDRDVRRLEMAAGAAARLLAQAEGHDVDRSLDPLN